jgi:hypothetical protein
MIASEIAQRLGHAVRVGHDWRCDCPVHQGHSLTVAIGRGGKLLVKCFGGCEWREIFCELRKLGLIEGRHVDVNTEREGELRRRQDVATKAEIEGLRRRIAAARDIYRRGKPAAGTLVKKYLRSRRIFGPIPTVLRFLEHCPHRNGGYYPAMLAPIVNVDGHQVAVHKTFFSPEGGKADLPKGEQRETRGPMLGGAVRLESHEHDRDLIVGEGIESTLSAMGRFQAPGWAALSAAGVEALVLPNDVRGVVIAADNDENFVGQRAAIAACERWRAEGRHVRILLPPNAGTDFNDSLTQVWDIKYGQRFERRDRFFRERS